MGAKTTQRPPGLTAQAELVQARLDGLLPLRDLDLWSYDHSSSRLITDGGPPCVYSARVCLVIPSAIQSNPCILISETCSHDAATAPEPILMENNKIFPVPSSAVLQPSH